MKGSFAQLGGNGYVNHERYLESASRQQNSQAHKKPSRRKNFDESVALAARLSCHPRARLACAFTDGASG
jgi:hypothetical protein